MFRRISLGIMIVLGLALLGGVLIWGGSLLHPRLTTASDGPQNVRINNRPATAPGAVSVPTNETVTARTAKGLAVANAQTSNSQLPVICIDPGHPSEVNAGATIQNGLREVEVVFDVAMQLKAVLEEQHIARVVMTRDFRSAGNSVVTNKQRAEIVSPLTLCIPALLTRPGHPA